MNNFNISIVTINLKMFIINLSIPIVKNRQLF